MFIYYELLSGAKQLISLAEETNASEKDGKTFLLGMETRISDGQAVKEVIVDWELEGEYLKAISDGLANGDKVVSLYEGDTPISERKFFGKRREDNKRDAKCYEVGCNHCVDYRCVYYGNKDISLCTGYKPKGLVEELKKEIKKLKATVKSYERTLDAALKALSPVRSTSNAVYAVNIGNDNKCAICRYDINNLCVHMDNDTVKRVDGFRYECGNFKNKDKDMMDSKDE